MCRIRVLAAGLAAAVVSSAVADTLWNENTQGDLSGDRFVPSSFVLGAGTHTLTANSGNGDREYVSLTVPAGMQLSSILLVSYSGTDGTSFIGVQSGTAFTEPPTGANPANLLGYAHFGTGPGNVGTDILDNIALGIGSQGFTPPLMSGAYTFWLQQAGTNTASYSMDFVVVPAPWLLHGLAIAGLFRRGRRRSF